MPDITEPLLSLQKLQTQYAFTDGSVARSVDGIDLDVYPGELVAIVGESGCGKSTTALSIMRLIMPPGRIAGGQILFAGTDLMDLSEPEMARRRGKDIAMVFQNPITFLNPTMRIGEQIAESCRHHLGIGHRKARALVLDILARVQIPDPERTAAAYPHQLSGGMNQRVLIAMALVCEPALVVLDEPTTALDVRVQREIIALIQDLKRRLGISMLLITHDFGLVAELADRVYIMYAGQIIEHGDVFDIFAHPQHPYTQALLGSVLSINQFKESLGGIEGSVPDLRHPPKGCRFADRCPVTMDRCRIESPPLKRTRPGHATACWLQTQ